MRLDNPLHDWSRTPAAAAPHAPPRGPDGRDGWLALSLALIAALATLVGAHAIGDAIFDNDRYRDVWFDSDTAAYYTTLADRSTSELHRRTYKHPLMSLGVVAPVRALELLGMSVRDAVRCLIALIAGLWLGGLFLALRLMACRRPEAFLLCLIAGASSAALLWFPLVESFGLGSIGLVWALAFVAVSESRPASPIHGAFVSLATLAVTVTNWCFGLLALLLALPAGRLVRSLLLSGAIFVPLVLLQHRAFGSAWAFDIPYGELRYIVSEEAGGVWNIVRSFFVHTVVTPAVRTIAHPIDGFPILSVQFSRIGSSGPWGVAASVLWVALLGTGLVRLLAMRTHRRVRVFVGLGLLGQLCLHLIYTGRETVLYSLHFLPFLIAVAALGGVGDSTKAGRAEFVGLLYALLVSPTANNVAQFSGAARDYVVAGQAQGEPRP